MQHQLQLILGVYDGGSRRQLNPLYNSGGGKDDIITTGGDRASIYTVKAPYYNTTHHPLRGGSRRRSGK